MNITLHFATLSLPTSVQSFFSYDFAQESVRVNSATSGDLSYGTHMVYGIYAFCYVCTDGVSIGSLIN